MVEDRSSLDRVFRALGDPTRLRMIEDLARGERTVGELAEPAKMTLAGASKHVGVLERAGLQPQALLSARDWVQRYTEFWNERLDALETALKEDGDE